MALFKNEVGPAKSSKLYVWSATKGAPSKRKAVITAHGGAASSSGMASTPLCNLYFYSPHGHILNDPSLEAIISGSVLPCEGPVNSRISPDYELAKYTDTTGKVKHNKAGETYATVGVLDERFASAHKTFSSQASMLAEMVTAEGGDQFMGQFVQQSNLVNMYRDFSMDIITIRNRFWHGSPKLSDVLKLLAQYGYNYEEIHCNFCRGAGAGFSPAKVDLNK